MTELELEAIIQRAAGAGAKSADFVASGTLGSGVTVALKADGTVEAVASTTT